MDLFRLWEDGKEFVGGLVDGATDVVGEGLRRIGLDDAADTVEDFGDDIANAMGAMPDEEDLEETRDPKRLILGDPAGITSLAERFTQFAGNFSTAGDGLRAISLTSWSGQGSAGYGEASAEQFPRWFTAADAATKAAATLTEWAGVVEFAQQKAAEAARVWEDGLRKQEEWRQKAEIYNEQLDDYANDRRETPPVHPGPNPWPAYEQEARRILRVGRDHRNASAPRARAELSGAANMAPPMPSAFEQAQMIAADSGTAGLSAARHFGAGLGGSLTEVIKAINMMNPTNPYNVARPHQYARNNAALAAGLIHTVAHPDELVRGFIGSGWSSDPAQSLGNLTGNILMTVAPGPKGTSVLTSVARGANRIPDAPTTPRPADTPSPRPAGTPQISPASHGAAPSTPDAPASSPSLLDEFDDLPVTHDAPRPPEIDTDAPTSTPVPTHADGPSPSPTPEPVAPAPEPTGPAGPTPATPTPDTAGPRSDAPAPDQPVGAGAFDGPGPSTGHPDSTPSSSTPNPTPAPLTDGPSPSTTGPSDTPSTPRPLGDDDPPGPGPGETTTSRPTGEHTPEPAPAGRGEESVAVQHDPSTTNPSSNGHIPGRADESSPTVRVDEDGSRSTPPPSRTDTDAPNGHARPTPVVSQVDSLTPGHSAISDPPGRASAEPDGAQNGTPVAPVAGHQPLSTPHNSPDPGQPKPVHSAATPGPAARTDAPAAPPRTPEPAADRTPVTRASSDGPSPAREPDRARPVATTVDQLPDTPVRHTPDRDVAAPPPRSGAEDRSFPAAVVPDRPMASERTPSTPSRGPDRETPGTTRDSDAPDDANPTTPRDIDNDTGEPFDASQPERTDAGAVDHADTYEGNERPEQCRSNGEPVNVATGEYFLPLTDVDLPGVLPLRLTHRHRSRYRWGRWMGPTTPSTFDARAIIDDDTVTIVDADGTMTTLPAPQPDAVSRSAHAVDLELRTTPTGGYQLTQVRDQVSWFFVPIPELDGADVAAGSIAVSAMTDRHRNRIQFVFDDRGCPSAVEHSAGYRVDVQCDGARILGYRLTAGLGGIPADQQLCAFAYHRGNLAAVTNAAGATTSFGYDDAGRMTSWRDSLGMEYWNRYDDLGRVTIQSGMNGVWSGRFDYQLRTDGLGSFTTYTDAVGAVTVYGIDTDGRVRQESDPTGRITAADYNSNRQPLTITGPDGTRTRLRYNGFGDIEQATGPDGAVTDVTYAGPGRPERIVAPGGVLTRISYDDAGVPLTVTDNAGAVASYTYDDHGAVASTTDPDGVVTRYRNNAAGLPVEIIDALGNTTRVRYDGFGRPVEVVDAEGARTVVTYDAMGNRTSVTAPDGGQSRWEYDGEGNCVTHVDPVGAVTRWEYGHYDLPTARIDADGSRTEFTYDTARRLVAVTNPDGLVWSYTYNADGTLAGETDFNNATTTYTYDPAGRLASRTNAVGQTVHYSYDAAGRRVAESTADPVHPEFDGERTEYVYDLARRLESVTGVFGRWRASYTAAGLPASTTLHDGQTDWIVESSWTGAGRLASVTTPTGVHTKYGYDPRGVLDFLSTAGRTCDITTSPTGREQRRRYDGVAIDSSWDPVGRLTARTVATVSGNPAALNLGFGTDVGDKRPARTVAAAEYNYRSDGILTSSTTNLGGRGRTDYRVDVLGRVIAAGAEQFAYDATGNITDYATSDSQAPEIRDGVRSLSPDVRGDTRPPLPEVHGDTRPPLPEVHGDTRPPLPEVRGDTQPPLPEVRGVSRGSKGPRWRYSGTLLVDDGRTSYRYDAAGRVTTMSRRRLSRKPDVWHYTWDAHDRLRAVTTPDGTVWSYTYDHLGRRLSKTNQASRETTRFHWHDEQLIEQTESADGDSRPRSVTTWSYAPDAYAPLAQVSGELTSAVDGTTVGDPSTHDDDLSLNLGSSLTARTPKRHWTQSEVDREFFAIVTDQIATPTALVDPVGGELAGRSVRTLYGQTTWTGASTPWSYPGQYHDDETGLHYNRHRYYHPGSGRYLSPDPLGLAPAPNPHTYPTNPTAFADPLGLAPTDGCGDSAISSRSIADFDGEERAAIEKTLREIKHYPPESPNPENPRRLRERWGFPFENDRGLLPGGQFERSPYLEYRVLQPPNTKAPGPRRVVIDTETGDTYYTDTHYGDRPGVAFWHIR